MLKAASDTGSRKNQGSLVSIIYAAQLKPVNNKNFKTKKEIWTCLFKDFSQLARIFYGVIT